MSRGAYAENPGDKRNRSTSPESGRRILKLESNLPDVLRDMEDLVAALNDDREAFTEIKGYMWDRMMDRASSGQFAPLAEATIRKKIREGAYISPLTETGEMLGTMIAKSGRHYAYIQRGPETFYTALHNEGFGSARVSGGEQFKQRQFLRFDPEDVSFIEATMDSHMLRAFQSVGFEPS